MVFQSILSDMTDEIVNQFHPNQVILFGSLARGPEQEDSDVDLLVVLPEALDKRKTAIQIRRALAHFSVSKDIVVATPDEIRKFRAIKGSFLRSVLIEGKILYERA